MAWLAFPLQVSIVIIAGRLYLVFYIRLFLGFIRLGIRTLPCGLVPYVQKTNVQSRRTNAFKTPYPNTVSQQTLDGIRIELGDYLTIMSLVYRYSIRLR